MGSHPGGCGLAVEDLDEVVATNAKRRFEFSGSKSQVRARQAHSLAIDLGLDPATPPDVLFHGHGIAARFLAAIKESGLVPGSRQYVHLSIGKATVHSVGSRHGKLIVLRVDSMSLHQAAYEFFLPSEAIWLPRHVPPGAIQETH